MGIDILREVYVRASDVKEAVGIPLRQLGGLLPAHNIIGDGSHLRRQLWAGTKRVERVESHVTIQPGI